MRRGLACVLLAGLAAAPAGAATAPAVPRHSQLAIAHKRPVLAYVPTRVGFGFRYYKWETTTRPALRIRFRDRAKREIAFVAAFQQGECAAGREKTFQLAGNKVFWAHTATEQQAWRCVKGANGRLVRLTVATAIPPTAFADVGIGRVAASVRRIQ